LTRDKLNYNLYSVVLLKNDSIRSRDERGWQRQNPVSGGMPETTNAAGCREEHTIRLNEATRKIIAKEKPWLLALIPDNAETFHVQVIDLNTLELCPNACRGPYADNWYLLDEIYLIDSAGRVIGKVGEGFVQQLQQRKWRWQMKKTFPFFQLLEKVSIPKETQAPETVGQALERIQGAEKTRYVLCLQGHTESAVDFPELSSKALELSSFI